SEERTTRAAGRAGAGAGSTPTLVGRCWSARLAGRGRWWSGCRVVGVLRRPGRVRRNGLRGRWVCGGRGRGGVAASPRGGGFASGGRSSCRSRLVLVSGVVICG